MAVYRRLRELLLQLNKEVAKRLLLCIGTSVLRCFAIGSAAANVANADGLLIMPRAMCSHLCQRSAVVDRTIAINHFVIPDCSESTRPVPSCDVLNGKVLALRGCSAMDYYFRNGSHDEIV